MVRVGLGIGNVECHFDRFDRTGFDKAANHTVGHISDYGEFADETLTLTNSFERLNTFGRQSIRDGFGRAIFHH